jgi:hypothetical protein
LMPEIKWSGLPKKLVQAIYRGNPPQYVGTIRDGRLVDESCAFMRTDEGPWLRVSPWYSEGYRREHERHMGRRKS